MTTFKFMSLLVGGSSCVQDYILISLIFFYQTNFWFRGNRLDYLCESYYCAAKQFLFFLVYKKTLKERNTTDCFV